jgi:uncharacterized protein YjdB
MTSICVNTSITLSNDSTGGAWSSNDITIATVDTTGMMTGIASGMTTITYTLPTSCFVTADVTVNPAPIIGAITGTTNECPGATTTLADTTVLGTWSSSDMTVATIDAAGNVTGIATGTTTITYSVSNIFGCAGYVTVTDTVNSVPAPSAISGTANVCVGGATTVSDATTGGVWSSSDATVATIDASGNITAVTAGTATISYTVTNASGCTGFVTRTETVNALPAISAITGQTSTCTGLTFNLSDSTAGGAWSSSNTAVAAVNASGTVTGIDSGAATISYTLINMAGCSNTVTYDILIGGAVPTGTITPSGTVTLCNHSPISLVLSASGPVVAYQWYIDGNLIPGATNATYTADTTGLFTVTLDNGTCIGTLTPATTIIAAPNPVISFDSAGNFLFTGTYNSYQWYFNNSPISGANGSTLLSPTAGFYKVAVSDANGCVVLSGQYDLNTTGIANTPVATDVHIYPNPATSTLHIDAAVAVNVSLVSYDGKVVISQNKATSIDVTSLAEGLYMIMVYDQNNNLIKTEKFVKVK